MLGQHHESHFCSSVLAGGSTDEKPNAFCGPDRPLLQTYIGTLIGKSLMNKYAEFQGVRCSF